MTLRSRLTITVAVIVALAIAGGAYAAHYDASRELRAETDRFLLARSERLARAPSLRTRVVPGFVVPGGVPEGLVGLDSVTQILRSDGTVEARVSAAPALPVDGKDLTLARDGGRARFRDVTVDGIHYRVLTTPLPDGGAVQVARAVTETDDVLAVLRNRLLAVAAAGAALAAAIAFAVARRATRPVRRLTEATERIASTQELALPIEVHGRDEVARLATSFNAMLAALDMSREQQKRLVMDASHELRTPLTAVRTNVDFLARAGESLEPAERAKLVAETRTELDELSDLVLELVELATAVRGEEPVEQVDLAEVASDVAARYHRRTGRAITVSADPDPDPDPDPDADADGRAATAVRGRRALLDRAVSNLVDNAVKFSPDAGPVEIRVGAGQVEVRDRGPGIAEEDRSRVFDRFYRSTASRSLPGSGLGLAIVKQVAELHGGAVSVRPRDGGGTVARLDLPTGALAPPRRARNGAGAGAKPDVTPPDDRP